jgi:methyl-accepting chemotaxis protein
VSTPRRRRFFDVLRRAGGVEDAERPALATLDDAGLWSAHGEASRSLEASGALAERVAAAVARQRGTVDAAGERANLMAARAEGLSASSARVSETFERLGVVALNAGLEGARVPEPAGRALLLVSDEVRAHVARGAEAARELATIAREVADEAVELRRQLERSRGDVGEVGEEAAKLRASTGDASRAIDDLGQRLRKATGVDPELARAVALAAEHARGLMGALSTLATAPQAKTVVDALRPLTGPLAKLLDELGTADDAPHARRDEPG